MNTVSNLDIRASFASNVVNNLMIYSKTPIILADSYLTISENFMWVKALSGKYQVCSVFFGQTHK